MTRILSPVRFASCSRSCRDGFSLWSNVDLSASSCGVLIVVLGPRRLELLRASARCTVSSHSHVVVVTSQFPPSASSTSKQRHCTLFVLWLLPLKPADINVAYETCYRCRQGLIGLCRLCITVVQSATEYMFGYITAIEFFSKTQ